MTSPSHTVAPKTAADRQVAIVVLPRFTLLVLGCIVDALRLANRAAGRNLYGWTVIGLERTVVTSSNVKLSAELSVAEICVMAPDIAIVCVGVEGHHYIDKRMLACLLDLDRRGAITGAVSTGVWSLAQAGLLNGRRCAVHWDDIPSFSARFPLVDVQREIFALDGRRMTCSGGAAVIDMMLNLIAMQHLRALADDVADLLIHPKVRTGTDKQRRSERGETDTVGVVRRAIALMEDHVELLLPIDDLAARVGHSPRQLERLFARAVNMPPKRYYDLIRLKRARKLVTETELPITEVAIRCGYQSSTQFSVQFKKAFEISPSAQRQEARR